MGAPMCGHLLAAGHEVVVYTRTRERAEPLLAQGAQWADDAGAAAAQADVIFTMLGFPDDVRATVLGTSGLLARVRPGSLYVDTTTSEPSLAVEIHEAARRIDVAALDAPVSGGDIGARKGALTVMVGGDREAFARAEPFFRAFGERIVHQGGAGAGQHTKMANQIAIATNMIGVCEALLYAYRAGLDLEVVLDTIGAGAAGSFSLSSYGPRLLRGDLAPGFKIDHFVKDLRIALDEARRLDLALPGLALAEQLYADAQAQGLGQNGTQALLVALARAADVEWPSLTAPREDAR